MDKKMSMSIYKYPWTFINVDSRLPVLWISACVLPRAVVCIPSAGPSEMHRTALSSNKSNTPLLIHGTTITIIVWVSRGISVIP